jgi:prophage regulatory protein
MRLLTLKQVKEITLLSTAKIYRLMKKDKFPKQIKLSERTSRWFEMEILEFINQKMSEIIK